MAGARRSRCCGWTLPPKLLREFIAGRKQIDLPREADKVRACGASLITLDDADYPELLRQIPDPPVLLYVIGALAAVEEKAFAIVGTRKPTKYGVDCANKLAFELAEQGVTIVSGLAQGIDSAAHRGALDAGGRTIAVMATGIDAVYPSEHHDLADEICRHGALITEMPIGSAPLGKNFPRRNRIISGLALGVLVAEAPEKSGAMNTVDHASNQGREVFALPHNIFNRHGRGCNRLLQEGANFVMEVNDVLEALDMSFVATQTSIQTERVQPTDDTERLVLEQLGAEPQDMDSIVRQTALPASTVSSTLVLLELKGLAESAGPMQYCLPRQTNMRKRM